MDSSSPRTELDRLARLLCLSEGFALAFVRANLPVDRERMARELSEIIAGKGDGVNLRILRLEGDHSDLLDGIQALDPPFASGEALLVFGLESAIPGDPKKQAEVLERLNRQREAFRELPGPLVLFLPEYALSRLAREAPDLWAWRSGVFEAEALESEIQELLQSTTPSTSFGYENLTEEQKRELVAALLDVLHELETSGDRRRISELAELHLKVASLLNLLGEWESAEQHLAQVTGLCEDAGFVEGKANALGNWGLVLHKRGRYEEAAEKTRNAQALYRKLGDRAGVAATTYHLGNVLTSQGSLDEAIAAYEEALAVFEEMDDIAEVGRIRYNLGVARRLQGQPEQADPEFRRSFEIAERLGDLHGLGLVLDQLGRIAREANDRERARELFDRALSISRDLGDRYQEALALHELADLAVQQGDLEGAQERLVESFEIAEELGERWLLGSNALMMASLLAEEGKHGPAIQLALGAMGAHMEEPPHRIAHTVHGVARLRQKVGSKKFDRLVREQYADEVASTYLDLIGQVAEQGDFQEEPLDTEAPA